MDLKTGERTSRRALLAAAAGSAAAIAASRLIDPASAAAVSTPVNVNEDNPSTAVTSITQATADTGAFAATAAGIGAGVQGTSTGGAGVLGITGADGLPAVVGLQGDITGSSYDFVVTNDPTAPSLSAGAYAFSNGGGGSIGVVGESGVGVGAAGFGLEDGSLGILAIGALGAFVEGSDGAVVFSDSNGTGLQAHTGLNDPPIPPANTALFGSVDSVTQVGIEARGRVRFPNRSGRSTISTGHSSVTVSVPGVTSSNFAIATINSNRSGRWVRAAVCTTGHVTIYLNTTASSATYVAWLVLG